MVVHMEAEADYGEVGVRGGWAENCRRGSNDFVAGQRRVSSHLRPHTRAPRKRTHTLSLSRDNKKDGLAVRWGLGNKFSTAEECALQCWQHRPGLVDGEFKAAGGGGGGTSPSSICSLNALSPSTDRHRPP